MDHPAPPQVSTEHAEPKRTQAEIDADATKQTKHKRFSFRGKKGAKAKGGKKGSNGDKNLAPPVEDEEPATAQETMEKLETSRDGLTGAQVQQRQEKYGKNALEEQKYVPRALFRYLPSPGEIHLHNFSVLCGIL